MNSPINSMKSRGAMNLTEQQKTLTAVQEILLAAGTLNAQGKRQFSEWDLTVAAWQRNKNRFGCRGYEDKYPDHKRVMMEIMGKTKKDNPIHQGWFVKVRANYYRITDLGLAEADRLERLGGVRYSTNKSAQLIYDAIARYVFHPVFRKHLADGSEPRTWLGAQAFLELNRNDATALQDAFRKLENAISAATRWVNQTGCDSLRSGPVGGKKAILREDIERLPEFVQVLKTRFAPQIEAISRRGPKPPVPQ